MNHWIVTRLRCVRYCLSLTFLSKKYCSPESADLQRTEATLSGSPRSCLIRRAYSAHASQEPGFKGCEFWVGKARQLFSLWNSLCFPPRFAQVVCRYELLVGSWKGRVWFLWNNSSFPGDERPSVIRCSFCPPRGIITCLWWCWKCTERAHTSLSKL